MDDCDVCGGSGEVEITAADGKADYFGCPACIAREKDEQIAELEKNAGRYLWLRDKAMGFDQVGAFTPYVIKGQLMTTLEGETLDAAIDAAMAKTHNEQGNGPRQA